MGVLREYRILNGSYNEMGIEEYDDREGTITRNTMIGRGILI